jgi:hypothetical protein
MNEKMVTVPVKPTKFMLTVAGNTFRDKGIPVPLQAKLWSVMLAAWETEQNISSDVLTTLNSNI